MMMLNLVVKLFLSNSLPVHSPRPILCVFHSLRIFSNTRSNMDNELGIYRMLPVQPKVHSIKKHCTLYVYSHVLSNEANKPTIANCAIYSLIKIENTKKTESVITSWSTY